jgi:hypothetical protein
MATACPRFCLVRQGRVHFLNREPTFIVFDLDERRVLEWVGLPAP